MNRYSKKQEPNTIKVKAMTDTSRTVKMLDSNEDMKIMLHRLAKLFSSG